MLLSEYRQIYKSLLERSIGMAKEPITVELDIDNTVHADERQTRHGVSHLKIEDKEIMDTVELAMPQLSDALLKDFILVNETSILIHNKKNALNVAGTIVRKGRNLVFRVITVMRKKDFKPYSDNYVITVGLSR